MDYIETHKSPRHFPAFSAQARLLWKMALSMKQILGQTAPSMVCYLKLSLFRPQASNFCQASMRGIKIGSLVFMNIDPPPPARLLKIKVCLMVKTWNISPLWTETSRLHDDYFSYTCSTASARTRSQTQIPSSQCHQDLFAQFQPSSTPDGPWPKCNVV